MEPINSNSIDDIIQAIKSLPKSSDKNDDIFEIGLVMAGAVSAGAYTAGVIDFLIEALEEWEKNRDEEQKHNVKIRVMSGASAGGIQAALTSVMFHLKKTGEFTKSFGKDVWVDEVSIDKLLTNRDLSKHFSVRSLLDGSIIEDISKKYISDKVDPAKGWTNSLPYVDDFKIYLTLTNLRGLPYQFKLDGESGFRYGMREHADYLYQHLDRAPTAEAWEQLRTSAIATGAFPVGLPAQLIRRKYSYYHERQKKDNRTISPFLYDANPADENFNFVAVDGGALDNEPLELARKALYKNETNPDSRAEKLLELGLVMLEEIKNDPEKRKDYDKKRDDLLTAYGERSVNKALILIDPFPNTISEKKNPTKKALSLSNLPLRIIGAIRGQAMFKPEELVFTGHRDNFNRFAIAPVRYDNEGNKITENAIACGFFEGFGGFLGRKFREHDYLLGRRNCQSFLRNYFVLPEKYFKNNTAFKSNKPTLVDEDNNKFFQIIPLKGSCDSSEEKNPDWPGMDKKEWKKIKALFRDRINAVLSRFLAIQIVSRKAFWISFILVLLILGFSYYVECFNLFDSLCDKKDAWFCTLFSSVNSLVGHAILYLILFILILWNFVPSWIFRKAHKTVIKTIEEDMEDYGIEME